MTTASSFPLFSTMEVPSMDDNMEMASPYHGPVDDFEIDIDIMEDQASNADRDMTAADDYMDNSHEENHGQDGFRDEDMIDDEAEPSMADADGYAEADRNIDIQFEEAKADGENKTYEADMLQDDFDEDIDAPVPDREDEAPVSFEQVDTEKALKAAPEAAPEEHLVDSHKDTLEPQPQEAPENLDETQTKSNLDSQPLTESVQPEQPEQRVEEVETTHVGVPHIEDTANDTNVTDQPEQSEPAAVNDDDHQGTYEELPSENKDQNQDQAESPADDHRESEVEPQEEQQVSESNDRGANQTHGPAEASALYPVKVYYQDNEISLFPPKEGDASETFFLEDEAIAHQSFRLLISACRAVLQDHINDNEVLVVDIDTLNLQLTEDSRETHHFSLKHIIDVYLQLCYNDSVEEPEALYLTLSTKLTVAAEVSELMVAASEGKGLSEIQSWEVYPEEGGAEHENVAQESFEEEHQENSNKESDEASAQEPTSIQDAHEHTQNDPDSRENETIENRQEEHGLGDADKPEEHVSALQNAVSPQAASHNSEEQNTESSGTLEPLPANDASEDRPETGEEAEHENDEENEEEFYEEGEIGDDAHHEHNFGEHPVGPVDGLEEPQPDYTGDFNEEHAEEYDDLDSGHHEQPPAKEDARNDTAGFEGDVAANKSHDLGHPKATESVLDEYSSEQLHHPQHAVDDSLDVTETLEAPESDSKPADQAEADNAIEPGEVDNPTENGNAVLSFDEGDEAEAELPFEDEDDYLDLGIADDLGDFDDDQDVASTSHAPGKRTREPDDELELPQSTTPDAKRSRSS